MISLSEAQYPKTSVWLIGTSPERRMPLPIFHSEKKKKKKTDQILHSVYVWCSHRIPSAKDFVRLVSPFPLAYGAMFTEQPIPFDQWSVGKYDWCVVAWSAGLFLYRY
jgi:hypothetical protein